MRLLLSEDLRGARVLDVGCGTGTLAFVAALEGARHVVAFDVDPHAAFATREQARANGIPRVSAFAGPLDAVRNGARFDVVVANMIHEEIEPLLPALRARLARAGRLLCSGQLVERRGEWEDLLRKKASGRFAPFRRTNGLGRHGFLRMSENAPSRPPRVYVPDLAEQRAESEERPEKEISLRKEERDHVRSRRLRDGDEVIALDGKGARALAVLAGRHAIALLPSKKILSSSSSSSSAAASSHSSHLPGEPANRVIVALACAEPARIEWAIEKGTECGAAGFVLLACERSQKGHVAALSSPARLERLRRIAVEATKQCDRTIVPFVEGPKSPEEFLRGGRERALSLVADPSGATIEDGPVPSRRTRVLSERSEFTREGEGAPAGRIANRRVPGRSSARKRL